MLKWARRKSAEDDKRRKKSHPRLADPGPRYRAMEAARFWGHITMVTWWELDPVERAELTAHMIEKSYREAYEMDAKSPASPSDAEQSAADEKRAKASMFFGLGR